MSDLPVIQPGPEGGRPGYDRDATFQKLLPHLHRGLSVHKACLIEGINDSTVYTWMDEDPSFLEKIEAAQNHLGSAIAGALGQWALDIAVKAAMGQRVGLRELEFMQWMALNSKASKGEFKDGSVAGLLLDPHRRIKQIADMIDAASGRNVDESKQPVQPTH